MKNKKASQYKGGSTRKFVRAEIAKRWGKEEAKKYDPRKNCFTFKGWLDRGHVVQKGEKAIKSYTMITEDKEGNELDTPYFKNVFLFYEKQVKKLPKKDMKITVKNGKLTKTRKRGAIKNNE